MISDGDLRRLMERRGPEAFSLTAGEAMNPDPKTISEDAYAATALGMMEEKKITSLIVLTASQALAGVLHLHDLWGLELM